MEALCSKTLPTNRHETTKKCIRHCICRSQVFVHMFVRSEPMLFLGLGSPHERHSLCPNGFRQHREHIGFQPEGTSPLYSILLETPNKSNNTSSGTDLYNSATNPILAPALLVCNFVIAAFISASGHGRWRRAEATLMAGENRTRLGTIRKKLKKP